tara:strand:+ start:10966 stop:11838 length:873 start_codon:yes stop_codon:yes gene_type:complete
MNERFQSIIKLSNVAVITGGASGIGLAAAHAFARQGMSICIADQNSERLELAEQSLRKLPGQSAESVMTAQLDVTNYSEVEALRAAAFERFGHVDLLMNNAGIASPSHSWRDLEQWNRLLQVNMFGVIHGMQAFTQSMIDQRRPSMIINTGSKQGITNPPGSPAYNVSKAAVKAITENLAQSLRSEPECQVSAHLLVPGFVYTEMIKAFLPEKPPFAWTAEQTVAYMLDALEREEFYIICPDGEVTEEMDRKRMYWSALDAVKRRPALSRWHDDYTEEFSAFMARDLPDS